METLKRIHESCYSQAHLECAHILTPTRHILQAIRRTWKVDRVHRLPAVAAPTFFPSASKNNATWLGPQGMKTVYLWDAMDDQDWHNTMATLKATREWTIWKTKDKEWSPALQRAGQSFECWVKTTSDIPTGAQESLTAALPLQQHNVGKGEYTVDLGSNEKLCWLGTESRLLGALGFEGACTVGDGSCDVSSRSIGAGFCNFKVMKWNTTAPLPYDSLKVQRTLESSKVGRDEEGMSSNRPELVDLRECLEAHEDHVDLLYLADSVESLQAIRKWIGCGAKLNFSKSLEADVLKAITLKLQKRVEAGTATLLIKVKDHRGDPLNEEADIRAELGRLKEYKEAIWGDSTDRTIYQWSVTSTTQQEGTKILKTCVD